MVVTSQSSLFLNIRSYVVLTGSMEPTISTGSIVFTRSSTQYKPQDIITYQSGTAFVTHRILESIVKSKRHMYLTKGDANRNPDKVPVVPSSIIGKVFFHIPRIGTIIRILQSPGGFILGILLPGLIAVGLEIYTIWTQKIKRHYG